MTGYFFWISGFLFCSGLWRMESDGAWAVLLLVGSLVSVAAGHAWKRIG
jgi:hypothetical protein